MHLTKNKPQLRDIQEARKLVYSVAKHTQCDYSEMSSDRFGAEVYFKREDSQHVRSYKIRGAFNKISSLSPEEKQAGIVCASAGNHAQGVSFSCYRLRIKGVIFMPETTPSQKIKQVELFGKDCVEVRLVGDTFDEAYAEALSYAHEHKSVIIPPFADPKVIEGQGTVGLEILEDLKGKHIDYLFIPIGGGGLGAGVSTVFKALSPKTKLIGLEPQNAACMKASIEAGHPVELKQIDGFVDGAAVKNVSDITFSICNENFDEVIEVPKGLICKKILQLYNEQGMVVEPAGALSVAALDLYKEKIKGKNIVCIISGGNNDVTRMQQIKEMALMYEGLKHYFEIKFPQRVGALKDFVNDVMIEGDDITLFRYVKKNWKQEATVIIGIELASYDHYDILISNMEEYGYTYNYINDNKALFDYILYS